MIRPPPLKTNRRCPTADYRHFRGTGARSRCATLPALPMRQVVIPHYGPPDVFEMRESSEPAPGEGELRIRVRAAGINFADILARLGLYPDAPKPPLVVGYEVAGRIDAIGR